MMRTGTSLVAGMLEALGVNLGRADQLLAAGRANPTGFREHREIIAINDRLLARFGGSWQAPPEFPAGWVDVARQTEGSAAAATIGELARAGTTWGWKDPRTCLTLPFWRSLAPSAGYVVCIRDPLEAADSLAAMPWTARQLGEDRERALDLWLRYTRDALAHTTGAPRIVLVYEDVLEHPIGATRALAALCGLPAPEPTGRTTSAIASLIRGDLRHHRAERRAPRHPAELLYRELRSAVESS